MRGKNHEESAIVGINCPFRRNSTFFIIPRVAAGRRRALAYTAQRKGAVRARSAVEYYGSEFSGCRRCLFGESCVLGLSYFCARPAARYIVGGIIRGLLRSRVRGGVVTSWYLR